MSSKYIVRLWFDGPLHIGSSISGVGEETVETYIHSDTIFSAIINNYQELTGKAQEVERLINEFISNNAPFKITSGFIFSGNMYEGYTYYLPKPIIDPPDFYLRKLSKLKNNKVVKKTKFVDVDMFFKWIKGQRVYPEMWDRKKGINDLFKSNYSIQIRPQHTSDRLNNSTMIYHTGLLYLNTNQNAGIYFIIDIKEDSIFNLDIFKQILEHMKMRGIGGEISTGAGKVKTYELEPVTSDKKWNAIFSQPKQEYYINLSLYYPDIHQLQQNNCISYEYVQRRGWIYSTYVDVQVKRKTCNMFKEGSVFTGVPIGKLVDVTPTEFDKYHKVYRYGIPIVVPVAEYWSDINE